MESQLDRFITPVNYINFLKIFGTISKTQLYLHINNHCLFECIKYQHTFHTSQTERLENKAKPVLWYQNADIYTYIHLNTHIGITNKLHLDTTNAHVSQL